MVLGVGVGGRGTVPPTGLPGHSCTPFPVTSGGVSYPGDVQIPAVSHTPASGPVSEHLGFVFRVSFHTSGSQGLNPFLC